MQRCKCYGCQRRCGCYRSEPTSQLAAGHHDAPQCEQPRVRRNLHTITSSHAPIIRTSSIVEYSALMFFCIQIPHLFCEEVNHWIDALPSPSACWAMPVGLDPCPQLDPPQPRVWGKAGMKISRRTYGTTWCINCKCQEHKSHCICICFVQTERRPVCCIFATEYYFMFSLTKSFSVWCVLDFKVTRLIYDG